MPPQPPSFYGGAPSTTRLPMPIDTTRALREGLGAVAGAVTQADANKRETDFRVSQMDFETQKIEHARNLQLRTGDAAAYIATEQGNLGVDLIKLRDAAGPGGQGHEEAVNDRIGKFRDTVTEYLGNDPEMTGQFVDNVASIGAQARVSEATWVAQQSALKSKTDVETLGASLANNLRTAVMNGTASGQMLTDADALYGRSIDAQPISATTKEEMKKAGHIANTVAVVEAMIDKNPHVALDAIDNGEFDDIGQAKDTMRTRARVAADHLDNELKQGRDAATAQARATEGNLIEDVNSGVMVDTATLQTAFARASASEKPEDIRLAHDLKIALAKNVTTAQYDNSTVDERTGAIREIEAKKDWQKDEQLVAAHDQLGRLIERDRHAAEADPLDLYRRQTHQELPPLDLADPAKMRQRFILADQAAQRYPNTQRHVFTEDEAKHLRDNYNSANPAGKADFILGLGLYGSQGARDMMRQIAPTKPELARLAEMAASVNPAIKQLVREAADGAAQPVKEGSFGQIDATARRLYGTALAKLPGDRRKAITQVATWIYAHRAAEGGKNTFDMGIAKESLDAALGGAGGTGGVGRARNGEQVVLPTGLSQGDFDGTLTLAQPEDYRAASNGVPQWDGRDIHAGEFRSLTPVLINDTGSQTLYAFRSKGGSGYVKTANGSDYVVDLPKLAKAVVARRKSELSPENLARYGYSRR